MRDAHYRSVAGMKATRWGDQARGAEAPKSAQLVNAGGFMFTDNLKSDKRLCQGIGAGYEVVEVGSGQGMYPAIRYRCFAYRAVSLDDLQTAFGN
ncbi:hypothetical protein N7471_002414 [Penicillium samsonianum]|uniref:uncharacterized protein n=1 Tax=Penicillium samsonianum TaxID=1882272 RepID=UPI0025488B84|nr:uncharacterized protein N7471_002414 [Penicillium samsonianum]KAJ6142961.1 hypothetical protein N7471_002414 [Penicillium samsonianum]